MTRDEDDAETATSLRAAGLAFGTLGDLLDGTACVIHPDTLACADVSTGDDDGPGWLDHLASWFASRHDD